MGLVLYSAEEMKGTVKSDAANPASAWVSCAEDGALSLHWKLVTLGWLRSTAPTDCAVLW
ncbi:hypothetical protein ACFQ9X_24760 [Catenulispora yoronensis]